MKRLTWVLIGTTAVLWMAGVPEGSQQGWILLSMLITLGLALVSAFVDLRD